MIELCALLSAQSNQKRNRGESFYHLQNSNTPGHGNIWVNLTAIGHIWDDDPIILDSLQKNDKQKWVSNVRGFPELKIQTGLFNIAEIDFESRPLSYGFKPGFISAGLKLTSPDNQDLRFHGFGLGFKYVYQFLESRPSLGGYTGFMPEGFFVKGNNIEFRFLYELDVLARKSNIPIRVILNSGARIPLRDDRKDCVQFLADAGIIFSGYGFDFFLLYSLEAFRNFFDPIIITQPDNKKIAVYFTENPMYLTPGGNLRYANGITLSVVVPLLLSVNQQSKMSVNDLVELHRKTNKDLYIEEKSLGIKDPFDPWFVKWKIAGTISFPLRFKLTSTELMRSFLMKKNKKEHKMFDFDKKIILPDDTYQDEDSKQSEDKRRLEEIKKKREQIKKSH
jgi:hypothetical protein